jgi:hypothetical protein
MLSGVPMRHRARTSGVDRLTHLAADKDIRRGAGEPSVSGNVFLEMICFAEVDRVNTL